MASSYKVTASYRPAADSVVIFKAGVTDEQTDKMTWDPLDEVTWVGPSAFVADGQVLGWELIEASESLKPERLKNWEEPKALLIHPSLAPEGCTLKELMRRTFETYRHDIQRHDPGGREPARA